MIDGMMECWNQLFLGCKEGSRFEFPNKHLEKSALQWVSVLLSFAGHENGRELIGQKAKQITGAVLNWIQEPDHSDALLIATISLLEALVTFYFCQEAFCKTIHIVRKTTERSSDDLDKEDMTVLSLRESFGNFCMEVLKCLDRKFLDSILIKCCNDKSIKFFWKVVEEREPDLVLPSDKSR
ncbi:uncharacterized protein LOC128991115 [Macrosteles quadrilineatus]|uniref:uncharacterized protein LOC128991115 n=1 Tax=Macrosteles quadrilineatus TaxID=74068 RepID=UPI0023E25484|nr:uncharacterized protein LOC128991115 [Macrosteles quadrilineatus]